MDIDKFCANPPEDYFDDLKEKEQQALVALSVYAIENGQGNTLMASRILALSHSIEIYVGGFRRGRKQPERENAIRMNVTSGSAMKVNGEKLTQLSPLYIGPVRGNGEVANTFENLWQYSKVYPQLGHWDYEKEEPTEKWWKWMHKGFNTLKNGKGVRTPPEISVLKKKVREGKIDSWTPIGSWWEGKLLGYIEARKVIYAPNYQELIREVPVLVEMRQKLENILILDLDGPSQDEYPEGALATEDFIWDKLNDPSAPFGHGYVVAAELSGIDMKKLAESRR